MHNFLEFMLKPYFYMELPTQYLALLIYPEAAYWLADSYYTPVKDLLASAREEALSAYVAEDEETSAADTAPMNTAQTAGDGSIAVIGGADGPTSIYIASSGERAGAFTYTVPYQSLYELGETLDLIINDDYDLERAYFFFTCLLTELYAGDMTMEILGDLETQLDALDPDGAGMTVTETETGMVCTLGGLNVFVKDTENNVTTLALTLPTEAGYTLHFDYRWDASGAGAALLSTLSVMDEEEQAFLLTAQGEGLPTEGVLDGEGSITFAASGRAFEEAPQPAAFTFAWSRTAAQKPLYAGFNGGLAPPTNRPPRAYAYV